MKSTEIFYLLCGLSIALFQGCQLTLSLNVCTPYDLPFKHSSYSSLCEELRKVDDKQFDILFDNAPNVTEATIFPLKGCTYGCVVGNSWRAYYADLPENGGSWNGKCFRDFQIDERPSEVMNIVLSPDGQYSAEAFPTTVIIDNNSWSKKLDKERSGVWVLDYSNTVPEFGRDFTVYRDEMRQLSENAIIGKVFTKNVRFPFTLYSSPVESFTFLLFQVCDESGGFAKLPYDREVEFNRKERVIPQELLRFSSSIA